MGVEEDPLDRVNVSDEFAREYVEQGGSPATVGDIADPGDRRSRTFYRGPDALVTDQALTVGGTTVYRLSELRNVGMVASPSQRRHRLSVWSGIVVLAGAASALSFTIAGRTAYAVMVAAIAVSLGFLLYLGRERMPHRWELRGDYRGRPVSLYSTTDIRVFNQVARALRRATEFNRPPSLFDRD